MEAMSEQDRFANGNLARSPKVIELHPEETVMQRRLDHWLGVREGAEAALERADHEIGAAALRLAQLRQETLF